MLRKQTLFIVAIVSMLVLLASCSKEKQSQTEKPKQEKKTEIVPGSIGSKAADFELVDMEGNPVSLDTYKNKVILLNFWATWCPPCRKEIPDFIEMYEKYKDQGFVIVGISGFREDMAKIKPFVEENDMNYPILFVEQADIQSLVNSYGGIEGIPTTFLIDPQGIIQHKWVGPITESDFLAKGKQFLQ